MTVEKKLISFNIYSPDISEGKKWFVSWWEDVLIDGKPKRKRFRKYGNINSFKTAAERHRAANKLIHELSNETKIIEHRKATIGERMQTYVLESKSRWKKKTYQTHQSKLNVFSKWVGNKRIDCSLISEFFRHCLGTRHNTTYNDYVRILGHILEKIGEGHLMENIQKVKSISTPARYYQSYQIKRLKKEMLETIPEIWHFVQFVYYCFIRPGELRLLKFGDIMLDDGKILVRSDISKNGKSEYVVIPDVFVKDLEYVRFENANDFVFSNDRSANTPWGKNYASRKHRKIRRKLGFSDEYKLYSWKHTGAVDIAKTGKVSLKELQRQLRHHSLDETDKYLRQLGIMDMDNLRKYSREI